MLDGWVAVGSWNATMFNYLEVVMETPNETDVEEVGLR